MTEEITIEEITTGESWACKFRVRTFVDENNAAVDTRNLKPGEPVAGATPGLYEGFGVIQTRDAANQLVELWDTELERVWTVTWDNCWAIDRVEWLD